MNDSYEYILGRNNIHCYCTYSKGRCGFRSIRFMITLELVHASSFPAYTLLQKSIFVMKEAYVCHMAKSNSENYAKFPTHPALKSLNENII